MKTSHQHSITSTFRILAVSAAMATSSLMAFAQEASPAPAGSPSGGGRQGNDNDGRGGDRRGGNREDFRKRMNDRIKGALKVNDEEWTVLQPLIDQVQEKQRATSGSRFGRGGGDDNNRGGSGGSDRPGAAESDALRKALENDATPVEELKTKLAAVRDQRKRASADLATAREQLQKVVTARQEAILVSMGILE